MAVLEKIKKAKRVLKEELFSLFSGLLTSRLDVADNKIVLTADNGTGYRCNPKYIAEELHRIDPGLDIVWLKDKDSYYDLPEYVRPVTFGSWASVKELATAKIWVDNGRSKRCIRKKDSQFYLQTWHAYLAPKKVEKDAADKLTKRYIQNAVIDAEDTDLMIANNPFIQELQQNAFWYDGEVRFIDIPRNEPLISADPEKRSMVCQALGIDEKCKICLYAPTFRKDKSTRMYNFDYAGVCKALEERFGGKYVFALRLHPGVVDKIDEIDLQDAINASMYSDTQELLCAVDVLISDYSSIVEDFVLTGRPGFVYAPDFEDYMNDRGLYYPLEERPWPVSYTYNELIESIKNFNAESFEQDRIVFLDKFGVIESGHGAQEVGKLLYSVIKNTHE
ncbi:CDP-glycerol glycerophosphotransferase family protein [Anaerotardibacter muris]|uniref:CDP-glycerol glycerophosphotransferase family protein n=1 Tax=Anaerotardibacter muris TaxID=2941505 RepID=UPI00203D1D0D|nr:CDP-glycerol glycerophosphotransferase family protein [Anaerotardibacter muris]